MSSERLQLNMLAMFEKSMLTDITITTQGREVQAHRSVLAAQSEFFLKQLSASNATNVEVPHSYKVVRAIVRFMYFGGLGNTADITPEEALDLLMLAEDLGVSALEVADIVPLVVPRLTMQNC